MGTFYGPRHRALQDRFDTPREGGLISMEEWFGKVAPGDKEA